MNLGNNLLVHLLGLFDPILNNIVSRKQSVYTILISIFRGLSMAFIEPSRSTYVIDLVTDESEAYLSPSSPSLEDAQQTCCS